MVLYCSIMILLLAFFIIIQSFATQQKEERFQSGQSSFKRALRTCGLGHLMDEYRRWVKREASGPRYKVAKGDEMPCDVRRIDVEVEAASAALKQLAQELKVLHAHNGERSAVLVAPLLEGIGDDEPEEGALHAARLFSTELMPILLERECRIGIGAFFICSDEDESTVSARALARASAVRKSLLEDLSAGARAEAGEKVYSFCQRVKNQGADDSPAPGEVRMDVFVRHFKAEREGETHESEDNL